jgi:hypothetical protein
VTCDLGDGSTWKAIRAITSAKNAQDPTQPASVSQSAVRAANAPRAVMRGPSAQVLEMAHVHRLLLPARESARDPQINLKDRQRGSEQ